MLEFTFSANNLCLRRVLCLGAHSDDIEIGCGATILKLAAEVEDLTIYWVVFSANLERKQEAYNGANAFLGGVTSKSIIFHDFKDGFFPYNGRKIKECFERIKIDFSPDLIFTHYHSDLHQDHRMISELTWNTFRNHLILEYEIPKYDGDLGSPNVFVQLSKSLCQRKIKYILDLFKTQREKHWFSDDLFSAILRLRGMEANAPSRYAEAFYSRKILLELSPQPKRESKRCGRKGHISE
jgi:LmbE family N-acetylglucosaminyl deacetylase